MNYLDGIIIMRDAVTGHIMLALPHNPLVFGSDLDFELFVSILEEHLISNMNSLPADYAETVIKEWSNQVEN